MMVDLEGRRCLVVGGGGVAERKVGLLLASGAAVCVVSPAASPRLRALASSGRIRLSCRPVQTKDLAGAFLVFAATDDVRVNRRVAGHARRAGILVNVADDPAGCSFLVPSVIRRGELTIAISTGGGSPALAKRLRRRLERTIGPEYETFLDALRTLRERAQAIMPDPAARQALFRRAVNSDLFERAAHGSEAEVAARIADLLKAASEGGGQELDGRPGRP
jgi:precorrin-2 dehydrogenase/sirohydrochlorin ferrochelatase